MWLELAKKNVDKEIKPNVTKNKKKKLNEKKDIITNKEYFEMFHDSKFIDFISDLKKENPPWILDKCNVNDIYEFIQKHILYEDIENERKEIETIEELLSTEDHYDEYSDKKI